MAFDISTAKPIQRKTGFDISTARTIQQQPVEQPMTVRGFGKNLLTNTLETAQGYEQAARPIMSTIIPGYGAAQQAGQMLVQKLQKQPVTMPDTGTSPLPQMTGEQAKQSVVGMGKELGQAVKHPIKYGYEKPVSQAMNLAMLAGGVQGGAKLLTKSPTRLMQEASTGFRTLLAPQKRDIQAVEIFSKKDLTDSFNLAAKEKLLIESSPDKKISTLKAIDKTSERHVDIQNEIKNMLEKRTELIDLEKVRKNAIDDLPKFYKTQLERNQEKAYIDSLIDAEIEARGTTLVPLLEGHTMKQGLWNMGYQNMKPTANKTARIVGHAMESEVGNIVPEVRPLNKLAGQYLTLGKLLNNAHGNVIPGGRIGQYFIRGLSAISGAAAGQVVPVVGPIGGAMIGERIGAKIAKSLSSPERLSAKYAGKMTRAESLLAKNKPTIPPTGGTPPMSPPQVPPITPTRPTLPPTSSPKLLPPTVPTPTLKATHFTENNFNVFKTDGLGSHFTSDPENFSGLFRRLPVRKDIALDIKNPLRLEDTTSHDYALPVAEELVSKGILPKNYVDMAFHERLIQNTEGKNIKQWAINNNKELTKIKKILQDKGYDGIVYENKLEGGGDSYIAFKPEQIKTLPQQSSPARVDEMIKGQGIPPQKPEAVKEVLKAKIEPPLSKEQEILKAIMDSRRNFIKRGQGLSQSEQGARLKGIGMQESAIKRKLNREPTAIEFKNAEKRLNTNYTGKLVDYQGKQVKLTGKTSFGKSEITIDGNKKFVSPSDLKSKPVTRQKVLDHLRQEALEELDIEQKIYRPTISSFLKNEKGGINLRKQEQNEQLTKDAEKLRKMLPSKDNRKYPLYNQLESIKKTSTAMDQEAQTIMKLFQEALVRLRGRKGK